MGVIDDSAGEYLGERLHTWETWGAAATSTTPQRVEVDVVVVGAGPGGLTTATVLAEAGLKVLVVEGGSYWPRGSFERKQSWALKHLYQDRGQRVMMGNAFISLQSGRGVGGGTLVNSAISFRAPDRVLGEWEREHGVDYLKDVDRDALYGEVERMLGVAPTAVGIAGKNTEVARRGFAALGVPVAAYMPRSAPGCLGCGTCQTGCPSGGKASADVTWLPRFLRAGGELYANTRVSRIVLNKVGRAVGVEAQTRVASESGEGERVVRQWDIVAGRVVLAAGAINTPMLLMAQGLGGDQVGRNLRVHPAVGCAAKFDETIQFWWGATQGYYALHPDDPEILLETFSASPDIILSQMAPVGFESMKLLRELGKVALCGLLLRDKSSGHIRYDGSGAPTFHYDVLEVDRVRMIKGLKLVAQMFFEAGARAVKPAMAGAGFMTSVQEVHEELDAARDPSRMQLYASHPMGTCRVGVDPARSVVRPSDGRLHHVEGLHITDSSLFPTALGVNPQMTIMAQSLALSRRIAKEG